MGRAATAEEVQYSAVLRFAKNPNVTANPGYCTSFFLVGAVLRRNFILSTAEVVSNNMLFSTSGAAAYIHVQFQFSFFYWDACVGLLRHFIDVCWNDWKFCTLESWDRIWWRTQCRLLQIISHLRLVFLSKCSRRDIFSPKKGETIFRKPEWYVSAFDYNRQFWGSD